MFSGLGYTEMIMIGVIALMLFGSKLPDVARNFGGTYRELRKKVDEFQREFRDWEHSEPTQTTRPQYTPEEDARLPEPTTPKFVPPPADDEDDA